MALRIFNTLFSTKAQKEQRLLEQANELIAQTEQMQPQDDQANVFQLFTEAAGKFEQLYDKNRDEKYLLERAKCLKAAKNSDGYEILRNLVKNPGIREEVRTQAQQELQIKRRIISDKTPHSHKPVKENTDESPDSTGDFYLPRPVETVEEALNIASAWLRAKLEPLTGDLVSDIQGVLLEDQVLLKTYLPDPEEMLRDLDDFLEKVREHEEVAEKFEDMKEEVNLWQNWKKPANDREMINLLSSMLDDYKDDGDRPPYVSKLEMKLEGIRKVVSEHVRTHFEQYEKKFRSAVFDWKIHPAAEDWENEISIVMGLGQGDIRAALKGVINTWEEILEDGEDITGEDTEWLWLVGQTLGADLAEQQGNKELEGHLHNMFIDGLRKTSPSIPTEVLIWAHDSWNKETRLPTPLGTGNDLIQTLDTLSKDYFSPWSKSVPLRLMLSNLLHPSEQDVHINWLIEQGYLLSPDEFENLSPIIPYEGEPEFRKNLRELLDKIIGNANTDEIWKLLHEFKYDFQDTNEYDQALLAAEAMIVPVLKFIYGTQDNFPLPLPLEANQLELTHMGIEDIEQRIVGLKSQRTDAVGWYNIGYSYYRLDRPDLAFSCFQTALLLDRNTLLAWINMGVIYSRLGRLNLSFTCEQTALLLNRNNSTAWGNMGATYLQSSGSDLSFACWQTALLLDRNHSVFWSNLSFGYSRSDFAFACIQRTFLSDRNHSGAWSNQSGIYYELGSSDLALWFRQLSLLPYRKEQWQILDSDFWSNSLNNLHEFQNPTMKLACIQQNICNFPEFEILWNALEKELCKTGKNEEAGAVAFFREVFFSEVFFHKELAGWLLLDVILYRDSMFPLKVLFFGHMKILWKELLKNDSETWSRLSRWELLGFYHHSIAQWFAVELSQTDCKSKDTPKYLQQLLFHRLAASWFTGDIKFDEPLQAWTQKNKDHLKLDKLESLALWWEIANLGNNRRNRELKNDFRELLKNEIENSQSSEVSETSELFKCEAFIRLALCTREKILQEIYPSKTPIERLEHKCTAFDNLIKLTETETESDNFQNMLLLTKDDLERLKRNAGYDLELAKLMDVANTGRIRFDPERLLDQKDSSKDRYKQISDAFQQCLDEDFQTIRHSDLNPLLNSGFPIISDALHNKYKTLCDELTKSCSIKGLNLPNFQPITSNQIKISLEPSSTGEEVSLESMDIILLDDWKRLHEAWWKIFDPADSNENEDTEKQTPGNELRQRCHKLIDDFPAEKNEDINKQVLEKVKNGIDKWLKRTQLDFENFGTEIPLSTLIRFCWGETLYDMDEPEGLFDQTDEMLCISPKVFLSLKYIFKDIFSNIKKHGQDNVVEASLKMNHLEATFNWANKVKISDNEELNTLKKMCETSKDYKSRYEPGDQLPKHIEERAKTDKGSGFYKFYRYRKNLAKKGYIVNQVWKLDDSDKPPRFQGWLTIKP